VVGTSVGKNLEWGAKTFGYLYPRSLVSRSCGWTGLARISNS
jgi:hypothetical protein